MNPSLYPYAGIDEKLARFPMYNFRGQMTGYIQYMPDGNKKAPNNEKYGKYHTYVSPNEIAVFGLESLHFSKCIYLVGGMFKAATLHRLGFAALHVSSVSYKALLPQLRLLQRPFLAIGDNDSEGAQFAYRYGGFQSPVDIDEMTDKKVIDMLTNKTTLIDDQTRSFEKIAEHGEYVWVKALNGNYKGELLTFKASALYPFTDNQK